MKQSLSKISLIGFNQQLQAKSVIKRGKHPSRGPSAYLVGKVFDETGDRLTPSKSKKSSGSVLFATITQTV